MIIRRAASLGVIFLARLGVWSEPSRRGPGSIRMSCAHSITFKHSYVHQILPIKNCLLFLFPLVVFQGHKLLTEMAGLNIICTNKRKRLSDDLFWAVSEGDMSQLSKIARESDVNVLDYDHKSPLHLACALGNAEAALCLMRMGADTNKVDRCGMNPLMHAIIGGHKSIILNMENAGAKLSNENMVELKFELCRCASEGDIQTIQNLVNGGVSVNAVDYGRRSALQLSAANGHLSTVEMLLASGADSAYKDRLGRTAFDDAFFGGHQDVLKALQRFPATALSEEQHSKETALNHGKDHQ